MSKIYLVLKIILKRTNFNRVKVIGKYLILIKKFKIIDLVKFMVTRKYFQFVMSIIITNSTNFLIIKSNFDFIVKSSESLIHLKNNEFLFKIFLKYHLIAHKFFDLKTLLNYHFSYCWLLNYFKSCFDHLNQFIKFKYFRDHFNFSYHFQWFKKFLIIAMIREKYLLWCYFENLC